jgi:hypothetical protein
MALPVYQSSSQTSSNTNASSVVVTKPAGLAIGDLMIAYIGFLHIGSSGQSVTTPSGWTQIQQINQNRLVLAAFSRIADSGDVAASNFTFNFSTTVDQSGGSIIRLNNAIAVSPVAASEVDGNSGPGDAVVSFTAASTPLSSNSLYLVGFALGATSIASAFTAATYTITPSIALAEAVDTSVQEGGSSGNAFGLAVAYGSASSSAQITEYGCTVNQTPSRAEAGILVIVSGSVDATASNALFQTSPVTFATLTGSTQSPTNDFKQITPDFFFGTARATNTTQWENEAKPTTEWTNE